MHDQWLGDELAGRHARVERSIWVLEDHLDIASDGFHGARR
jgi:hypothetical protein